MTEGENGTEKATMNYCYLGICMYTVAVELSEQKPNYHLPIRKTVSFQYLKWGIKTFPQAHKAKLQVRGL